MIYNKEMKRLGDFIFDIKLSHRMKNNCVEFQIDLKKYRSTIPFCLFTVFECHDRNMARIYNKEMKRLGDFMFGIKLSHRMKSKCLEFQTDLTK